jgi:alkanesulfonate monooxygenase SsuD/methylene tetrahydromethanopterin reductase-like flavin-dependent oxidoreductase (luciferase family)
MLRGDRPTLDGKYYHVVHAINEPPPVSRIPVMIGGGGEKKTLRMVAQYADESNIICTPDELPRKLDALAGHCATLGRDRSKLTVSFQRTVCIAETHDEAKAEITALLMSRGLDITTMSESDQAPWLANFVWGDPDEVAEQMATYLERDIDGFTINMPAGGHIEGRVELLGKTLAPLVTT